MKLQILLLAVGALVLGSCTTAYKTGQTPDDVYYSPARPQDEYVRVNERDNGQYRYDDEYYDDRYLRMKVMNRTRWSELNDYYYFDRYSYPYNYYYGTYYNPYNTWHYYYNPYCYNNVIVVNPKYPITTTYVKPRSFNLGSYTNTNYNNTNTSIITKTAPKPGISRPVFNTATSGSNKNSRSLGNTVREIFSGNEYNNTNKSSNRNSNSTRTYTPSSSTNSNSSGNNSSSGSTGGGVSRPKRGGN